MRRFEEWIKEVVREIYRADIGEVERTAILMALQAVKESREVEQLNRVMKKLHILGLEYLLPAESEIESWAESGEIRLQGGGKNG